MPRIEENVPLAPYTTLGIGACADYFVDVRNEDELVAVVGWAHERSLPITVIGGGSNVLVSDGGVQGLVIRNCIEGVNAKVVDMSDEALVAVGGGMNFDEFVAYTVAHGLWGLENLSGIPGSVGATPIQNVGAYGVEVSSLIESVRMFDTTAGTFLIFSNQECAFGYRDSVFKHAHRGRYVITGVCFRLCRTPSPQLLYKDLKEWFASSEPTQGEIREAVIEIRKNKFPDWRKMGTAGSFFKNPIIENVEYERLKESYPDLPGFPMPEAHTKVPLGWILDKVLDLKGYKKDNVGVYERQALVLVNHGNATADEVERFACEIERKVFEKINLHIEREVTSIS